VKFWDVATGKELDPRPAPWADPDVMAFSPDGKTMAAVMANGSLVQLRDPATGQVRDVFRGPTDRVTALAFGPGGRLFSGTQDGTILAWDPRAVNRPPAGRE
jgi:WD40 repeat protein